MFKTRRTAKRNLMYGPRLLLAVATILATATPSLAQWLQWGGPNCDFTVETSGLANKWPEEGPKKLWHRELGDGYSSILADEGVLYTMYRKERTVEEESVIALDSRTGKTIWEHKYPSALTKPVAEWGHGPNATPLIVDQRLFTVGTNGDINCLDKKTGKVHWTRDLVADRIAAPVDGVGYICSPIAYNRTVIIRVGSGREDPDEEGEDEDPTDDEDEDIDKSIEPLDKGQSVIALDQETGRTIWKSLDFETGASSPLLINFAGQDQLILFTSVGVLGADPSNGKLLWRHEVPRRSPIMTPVWNGEDIVFWSTANEGGAGLAIKLTKKDGKTVPQEQWQNKKMRAEIGTPVRIGDHAFGSSGRVFVGMNLETGKRAWAVRGYNTSSCVYGDGKLLILDEDGELTLATATPEALTVLSQCQITERYSYTPPTLVGTTLYVRDRKHIMALDLG